MTRTIVPYLEAAHALFNGLLFGAFVHQGLLGWNNRRGRLAGTPIDFRLVRRHRKNGPVLALLVPLGYAAGIVTALLDHATVVKFPGHLIAGTLLLVAVGAAALSGKRIQGASSPWRDRHAALGAAAVALFFVQALIGLSVLL